MFFHWVDILTGLLGFNFPAEWTWDTRVYGLNPIIIEEGCKFYEMNAAMKHQLSSMSENPDLVMAQDVL